MPPSHKVPVKGEERFHLPLPKFNRALGFQPQPLPLDQAASPLLPKLQDMERDIYENESVDEHASNSALSRQQSQPSSENANAFVHTSPKIPDTQFVVHTVQPPTGFSTSWYTPGTSSLPQKSVDIHYPPPPSSPMPDHIVLSVVPEQVRHLESLP